VDVRPDRSKIGSSINTKPLNVYHQNTRSLKCKKDELLIFVIEECNSPDIVCISEHHMDGSELLNFSMLGYKMAAGFSCKIHKNGGVCILVKDNISYESVDLHCLCKENIFEACAIIIQTNTIRVCIYASIELQLGI
jgi:hypothetical protein